MVDPGEAVTVTIRREFSEEALNKLEASPTEKKQIEAAVNALFGKGHEVGWNVLTKKKKINIAVYSLFAKSFVVVSNICQVFCSLKYSSVPIFVYWTYVENNKKYNLLN